MMYSSQSVFPLSKRARSCTLAASMLVILCVAVRVWLPNILDTVRYHVDLSYTIEWGPTYWVEKWMRDLGAPGIKLLCNTRADAPRHAVSGAIKELWYVRDPVYFDIFATAYSTPSSPITEPLLQSICSMYGKAQAASTPDGNVKKISAFLERVFNANSTPDPERQMAMAALWAGNVKQLLVVTGDKNPAIAERAMLMLAEAQPEKFISHKDSAVAGRAAFLLGETKPERHLATFANFLGDATRKDEIRESLAKEWCTLYYHTHRRPAETPLRLEELFRPALTACRSDGTPLNPVRVSIWKGLYWQTGKGVPITLSNSQQTSDWLDTMSDTVRSRWDFKNCGKGIPYPPASDAIETVRKCVTVPETDEDGDNSLTRRAAEFLGREYVVMPMRPRVFREAPAVQQAMMSLGLPDTTVAEVLASDNEEAIRKLIPFLVESQYFGLPTDKQKVANRLKDGKALSNLVKIGPAAVPLLLQCYQANAYDAMSLLNALVVCDPDFQAVLTWGEGVKANELLKVDTTAVMKSLPVFLLAHDVPRGSALILKGLADESPNCERLSPVQANSLLSQTNKTVIFMGKPHYRIALRNCDELREEMEDGMTFIPRLHGKITSETERDQALEHLRTWLSAESKPGGILTRVCWFRPLLVDREGKPFVADGELQFMVFSSVGSTSTFSIPYWLPFLPTASQPAPQVKVYFREKSQGTRHVFLAPASTNLRPGISVLELRLTEPK